MEEYLSILKKSNLFSGVQPEEISAMLKCLSARIKHYKKDEFIIRSGDYIRSVGMVLTGTALIIQEDFWGKRTIISEAMSGALFAETYACIPSIPIEMSVISDSECDVLFMDINRIMNVCTSACTFHTRLLQNFLSSIARRNLILTKKMQHMSKKTIREKLLSYLSAESLKNNSSTFDIPFNRQQLADYLSIDRSALSNEMSKLQDEGILTYKKNRFTLKEDLREG
ncbi:Crp/Fnr family transcriptional regulator [Lacrimispora sphenoides]|uniref:cAMP-binding domain of CRP or a regulatory subunit of cAMP-dependent protein kinases n=1 Tax=Lacrimispora sphenoides JCM 1415 TaxID=1297793 RepID=A0ABY1C9J0_9FIRM|nr:Crp/Fnr family transcriptional regulator [Lacrimispora sphenoides]SET82541.1 cAMP-binding domain of CRP or a regulatory subunit of cAMP-dependent protein kinases [[Clostridium] sphenoides JCM 1415]SUY51565.1 Crp/Fnr family transcriptional regulator [Lacrimispora sphenoides]